MTRDRSYPHNGQPRVKRAAEIIAWSLAVSAVCICLFVVISLLRWML